MSNLPLNHQDNGQPANDAGYAALMAVKPGERLRKARKERKLDLEAAAAQLNLSPSVLKALEKDDYAAMPSTTFVKGYIRSYARMLRLPGDELVRAFEYQTGAHSAMDEQHPVPQKIKKKAGPAVVVGVVVLIVVAVLWWFAGGDEPVASEPEVNQSSSEPVIDAQQSVEQDARPAEGSSPVTEGSSPVAEGSQPVIEEPSEPAAELQEAVPVSQPAPQNSQPVAVAPEPEPKVEPELIAKEANVEEPDSADSTAASEAQLAPETEPETSSGVVFEFQNSANEVTKGTLSMTFSEDCWVEIRNENERLIHANLHRAGSTYNKELPEPFDVKLGNGNAVKVKYNGNPIAFAQSRRSNVARFSIGQFSNSDP